MKTLALLLCSALSLTTACATDDSYSTGGGLRASNKPFTEDSPAADDDFADTEGTFDAGDGTIVVSDEHWDDLLGDNLVAVEDFIVDGRLFHRLYVKGDIKTPAN